MQHFADQFEKVITWLIVTLLSAVTFLVGFIFRRVLKSIDDRLDHQDRMILEISRSLSRLHERASGVRDIGEDRTPPRGSRRDRQEPVLGEDQTSDGF